MTTLCLLMKMLGGPSLMMQKPWLIWLQWAKYHHLPLLLPLLLLLLQPPFLLLWCWHRIRTPRYRPCHPVPLIATVSVKRISWHPNPCHGWVLIFLESRHTPLPYVQVLRAHYHPHCPIMNQSPLFKCCTCCIYLGFHLYIFSPTPIII